MRRSSTVLIGTIMAVSLATLPQAASGKPTPPDQPQGQPEHAGPPSGLRPGDVVRDHGNVGVIVPARGMGVWGEGFLTDGTTQEIQVVTEVDGTVVVDEWGDDAMEVGTGGGTDNPCSNPANANETWTWGSSTYQWHFNSYSAPGDINVNAVEQALRDATANITNTRNDCGFPDSITASHSYQGRSNNSTQIYNNSTCQNGDTLDSQSVTAFGDLPSNHVAYTCVWFNLSTGKAVQSDMKFNKVEQLFTVNVGSNCSNRYVIEAVATHERGHTFGAAHVPESSAGTLTMSSSGSPCQNSESTLGQGDIIALDKKY